MIKPGDIYQWHEVDSLGNTLLFKVVEIVDTFTDGIYITNWKGIREGSPESWSVTKLQESKYWKLALKPNTKPDWL